MIICDRCNGKKRFFILFAIGIFLVANLSGCGYKDLPLPPEQAVPKLISDLHYELSEKGVRLFWSYPTETVKGVNLEGIDSFDLYRAVVPVEDYCDGCPIPFGEPISIPGGTLPKDEVKTASYESSLLRPGHIFFFKVRSRTGWWATSKDSNVISFVWDIPPASPSGFEVAAQDSKVELKWDTVTVHLDSTPVEKPVRYQVYRSLGGKEFSPVGDLLEENQYTDTNVTNSKKYFYKVQAISVYEKGNVGGGFTDIVSATPEDRTAPEPPTDVKAVSTDKGIKVFWNPAKEKDVASYRVYRRQAGDKAPVLIGTVNIPYTIYVDRSAPKNVEGLYYSVSSLDRAVPPNESIRSPEVTTRNQ